MLRDKISALIERFDETFLERETVIRGAILALLSGEHVVMIGPPGTAKSMMARALCEIIKDGKYFDYLLTRFTTPEELFGPLSIKALEEDKFERKIEGFLPTAHVAFLDEIFKASSAILNSLLTIINERKFHMGSKVIDVPLMTLVGASNELPEEDESLEALYDRFLFRFIVDYVSQEESFLKIAEGKVGNFSISDNLKISVDEIKQLWSQIDTVAVPTDVKRLLVNLRTELNKAGMSVSDRRWRKIIRTLKIGSLVNGRNELEITDLILLKDMLWEKPEQIKTVENALKKIMTTEKETSSELNNRLDVIAGLLMKNSEKKREYDRNKRKYFYRYNLTLNKDERKTFEENIKDILSNIRTNKKMIDNNKEAFSDKIEENIFLFEGDAIIDQIKEAFTQELTDLSAIEKRTKDVLKYLRDGGKIEDIPEDEEDYW